MWRVTLEPRLKKSEFGDLDAYLRMYEESQGFDVCRLIRPLHGGIVELEKFKPTNIQRATEVARFAVDRHNRDKKTDIEFVKLVKANGQCVGGVMYYITLEARSRNLDISNIYQAKVYINVSGVMDLEFLRLRPSGYSKLLRWVFSKPCSIPKGAFFTFMNDLRKLPQLANLEHRSNLTSIASRKWRSMSVQEKVRCYHLRNLKYEDVAEFVQALHNSSLRT